MNEKIFPFIKLENKLMYDDFPCEKTFVMECIANSGGPKVVKSKVYLLTIVPLANEY